MGNSDNSGSKFPFCPKKIFKKWGFLAINFVFLEKKLFLQKIPTKFRKKRNCS